jgi:hypothetical protein
MGLVLSFASVAANADIVNVTEGDVGAFKDTASGLTWIDFGHTNFMKDKPSYDEAIIKINTEEKYKGWVLATESQIAELVSNVKGLELDKHEGKASVLKEIMGTNNGKVARATYPSGEQAKRFDFLPRSSHDVIRTGAKVAKLEVNGSLSIMLVKADK